MGGLKDKPGDAGQTWDDQALQAAWVGLGDGSPLCGYAAQQRKGSRVGLQGHKPKGREVIHGPPEEGHSGA